MNMIIDHKYDKTTVRAHYQSHRNSCIRPVYDWATSSTTSTLRLLVYALAMILVLLPVTVAMILGRVGLDIERLLRLRVLLMTVRHTHKMYNFVTLSPSLTSRVVVDQRTPGLSIL